MHFHIDTEVVTYSWLFETLSIIAPWDRRHLTHSVCPKRLALCRGADPSHTSLTYTHHKHGHLVTYAITWPPDHPPWLLPLAMPDTPPLHPHVLHDAGPLLQHLAPPSSAAAVHSPVCHREPPRTGHSHLCGWSDWLVQDPIYGQGKICLQLFVYK